MKRKCKLCINKVEITVIRKTTSIRQTSSNTEKLHNLNKIAISPPVTKKTLNIKAKTSDPVMKAITFLGFYKK